MHTLGKLVRAARTPLLIAAVIAVTVPVAQGSPSGLVQRLTAVEKKVKALQTSATSTANRLGTAESEVGTLKTDLGVVKTDLATVKSDAASLSQCFRFKVMPVADYGTGPDEGYLYARQNGAQVFLTSALDVAPAGQQQAYLAVVNPQCVTAASLLRPAPEAPARLQPAHR
jgi:hypothetical protein